MKSILEKFQKSNLDRMQDLFGDRQMNLILHYSIKDRYIWFKNPKAASSTLSSTLHDFQLRGVKTTPMKKAHMEPYQSSHVKPFQLDTKAQSEMLLADEYFRFAFVRNPYSRLVSAYLEKICGGKPQKKNILKLMGNADAPFETEVTFQEFIEAIAKAPAKKLDIHWMPQVYTTGNEWFELDFVGKLESFDDDFAALAKKIGPQLPDFLRARTNHRTNMSSGWQSYFEDKVLKKLVDDTYSADFEAFGYSTTIST